MGSLPILPMPDWHFSGRPAGRLIWATSSLIIRSASSLVELPAEPAASDVGGVHTGCVGVFADDSCAPPSVTSGRVLRHAICTGNAPVLHAPRQHGLGPSTGRSAINKHNIRYIIVVVISGIGMGFNVGLFVAWKKRGQEKPEAEAAKPRTSRFGRPLRRRAQEPVTVGASTNGGDA
jgi:hypothetical protein